MKEDPRCKEDVKMITKYNLKTTLAIPITNQFGKVDGVIQAINKLSQDEDSEKIDGDKPHPSPRGPLKLTQKPIFSRRDEGLLELLGHMAGHFLEYSIKDRNKSHYANSLRNILHFEMSINLENSLRTILERSLKFIKELFYTSDARIFLFGQTKGLKFVNSSAPEGDYLESFDKSSGIVSHCLEAKKMVWFKNSDNHPDFNCKAAF